MESKICEVQLEPLFVKRNYPLAPKNYLLLCFCAQDFTHRKLDGLRFAIGSTPEANDPETT
jgi:hypothetical protein